MFVTLDRGDYWQCAFVIRKGEFDELKARGHRAFLRSADRAASRRFLRDRVEELKSWDDVKLLTVRVDRLRQWWRPGLLCIGDAAHAMSPIGGVGINLAIQDAVAAANLLAEPLRNGVPALHDLEKVQQRENVPHALHSEAAGRHPGPDHQSRAGKRGRPHAALAGATVRSVALATPDSGARVRCRRAARARPNGRLLGALALLRRRGRSS